MENLTNLVSSITLTKKPNRSYLLRIPTEIRLKILRHILVKPRTLHMLKNHNPCASKRPLVDNNISISILKTCHLFHAEGVEILYKENTFYFAKINNLNRHTYSITSVAVLIDCCFNVPEFHTHNMAALVKFTESHPNARKLMMIFSTNITELSAFQASQLSVDLVKVRERMQEFRVRFSRFNYDDISYDEKRVLLLTTRNFSQIASGKALFSGLGP